MGIISTGITEGKGRAGVMIPIPGYSMYQARLLQHNTHQVIPINWCHLASLPAQPLPGVQTVESSVRVKSYGKETREELGEIEGTLPLQSLPLFFSSLINFSTVLFYPNAWNRLLPAEVTRVLRLTLAVVFTVVHAFSSTQRPQPAVLSGWGSGKECEGVECLQTLRACYRGFTSLFTLADQSNQACIRNC